MTALKFVHISVNRYIVPFFICYLNINSALFEKLIVYLRKIRYL